MYSHIYYILVSIISLLFGYLIGVFFGKKCVRSEFASIYFRVIDKVDELVKNKKYKELEEYLTRVK